MLQEAYRIGEALPPRGWHPLNKVLGDELRMVRIVLPWATTDLRAQVAPHAWATDATPTSGGAASAFEPPELRPIFLRECELKGASLRLSSPTSPLKDLLQPSKLKPPASAIEEVVPALEW